MTLPFISGADLSDYLKLPAGNFDQNLAVIALDSACEAVRGHIDQNIELTTVSSQKLHGSGKNLLIPPVTTINSISALSVFNAALDTSSEEALVQGTDYTLDSDSLIWRIDGGVFTLGKNNIVMSYVYGYSTVPADARLVALQCASRIYEFGMIETEGTGTWSATYVKGGGKLTRDEMYSLERHRRNP